MTETDDKTPKMHKTKARAFISRFRGLCDAHAGVDHELAGLAQEVRQEFPPGASGDYQFRAWVKKHFEVSSMRAIKLLDAARAFTLFPSSDEWRKLGGWPAMAFLLGLSPQGRRKVSREVIALANERGHGGYPACRRIAFQRGVVTRRNGGRPLRSEVEERYAKLRAFVASLYKSHPDLPKPPEEVARLIRTQGKLAQLAGAR